jgi:hypothetical protein
MGSSQNRLMTKSRISSRKSERLSAEHGSGKSGVIACIGFNVDGGLGVPGVFGILFGDGFIVPPPRFFLGPPWPGVLGGIH